MHLSGHRAATDRLTGSQGVRPVRAVSLRRASHGTLKLSRRCSPATVAFALLLVAGVCLAAQAAQAQTKTYCSEPVTPFCVNQTNVFEDSSAQERCRVEVDEYVEGMEEHADCLGKQQQEMRERAAEIQERFACMSRGESDCR